MLRVGRYEMGSSVEGLKLRRMRVRNDISFRRSTEAGTERSEDLEGLRGRRWAGGKPLDSKPGSNFAFANHLMLVRA